MLVEIFFPPEGTFCLFEPAFNVPYRLVHIAEVPATTLGEALDLMWRYANVVNQGDPWIKTGLRSAKVGDVFFVNGEAHAVMLMGFERFEFQREEYELILRGRQPIRRLFSPRSRAARPRNPMTSGKRKRGKVMGRRLQEQAAKPCAARRSTSAVAAFASHARELRPRGTSPLVELLLTFVRGQSPGHA